MLKQRVITAVVLLVLVIAALLADDRAWFNGLALVFVTAAGWEWGRLNTARTAWQWGAALATLVLCLVGAFVLAAPLRGAAPALRDAAWPFAVFGVLWIVFGPLLLRRGVARWSATPAALRWVCGVVALVFAWLAIVLWRAQGINALLSAMALVWAADIGAYSAGRRWGRHKLAPSISPGKTWEGLFGGWVAVAILAVLWQVFDAFFAVSSPSIFTLYERAFGFAGMVAIVLLLTVMSVVGDLTESLVKRSAGMKDSSQLLPGHGGVLDRIDALLPALPIAYGVLAFAPLAARPLGLGS